MVTLDASRMTKRELTRQLKALASTHSEITIENPQAQHNIAVGILSPCKINIQGSVGYYAASLMDGPEVTIEGNAGWALGDNMMAGKIALTQECRGVSGSDNARR